MTRSLTATSESVRVTVASGRRRVDLALPGAVPVAELVPELARGLGLLAADTVHGGYRLGLLDGRQLALDASLIGQGVEDGGFLTLTAGVDAPAPRRYDDVAEAMTDVVERELRPWRPEHSRRTALATSALFLTLGAVAWAVQRSSTLAGAAAAAVAAVLLGAAVGLSRLERGAQLSVVLAWLAAAHAGSAGLVLAWQSLGPHVQPLGTPLAAAGGGVLLAGVLGVLGLAGDGRALLVPAAVVGGTLVAVGVVVSARPGDAAVVVTAVLVGVVLAGGLVPRLAVALAATTADCLPSRRDPTAEPTPIDAATIAADARIAHQILIGISGTVGLLLVLAVPFAVGLGPWGTLLAASASGAVMLRTRHYRARSHVLVGLIAGVAALLATGVAAFWLHPTWRPAAAATMAAIGLVALAAATLPGAASIGRTRLGDVAESAALILLLPLLVLASGALPAVG
jgi:type VII secretion integral membrane protein EccD